MKPKYDTLYAILEEDNDPANLPEEKFDLDKIIQNTSLHLFPLDTTSQNICRLLAIEPATNYQLSKIGVEFGLTRSSINIAITRDNGLAENDFVQIDWKDFREGKQSQYYNLTFKGIIASLATTKFESVFNIKQIRAKYTETIDNENSLVELFLLYAKYHTALVLVWCSLNKFDLINMDTEMFEFFGQSYLEQIVHDKPQYPKLDLSLLHNFQKILERFTTIQKLVDEAVVLAVQDKTNKTHFFFMLNNYDNEKDKAILLKQNSIYSWIYLANASQNSNKTQIRIFPKITYEESIDEWRVNTNNSGKIYEHLFQNLKQ